MISWMTESAFIHISHLFLQAILANTISITSAFYHKDVLHSSIYKPRQHSSKGRNKDEVYSYRHTQAFPHISGCRYPRETGLPCPAQGLGCTAHKAALGDRRDSHCGDNMTTLTIFQMKNLTILLLEFS